jgi:hypothetical protein
VYALRSLTPLVVATDHGTDQSHDGHDGTQEASPEDLHSRNSNSNEDGQGQQRPDKKPIGELAGLQRIPEIRRGLPATVANPPDLTIDTGNEMAATPPLNIDGNPTKVSGHTVMLHHGYKGDRCKDIVENAIASRLEEAGAEYG